MLLSNLNLLTTAPGGVARLRELILTLAVQGKLVPQDPKDEPASELLKKIRAEKDRLMLDGKITVTLFNAKRPSAWDEVNDWIDRHGFIANADVVRIARVDTLKASKLLMSWREQGLLVSLPGRAKRNMAYAKPDGVQAELGLLSTLEDNNGENK
jgi:hypothetical protein